ncbi:hypothetical protein AOQ84DRAFT_8099 [Glonium stellatum]|uniref:DUF7580 domain-containing protein n=1 Tax=Glonium stellatum TaxID=574774 RepID=A0A8E2F3T9_9PEZI|nr:hypothetical protein AOQ84DRAFT_8099 [Glonium stellatum]
MSSIEIARLTLGVFPLVLSALKYHNAAFGATKQQQSMPMQFQTECKNFRTTCARVLWLVFRNDDGLSAALNDPGDKMWQEPSLESDLIDVLGSAHPLFLELCQQMMSTVGCTKTELDKITDSKSSFSKRLRYSLKSGFIKSELCKIHLINESLRNLVRNAPNQRQLYQFKCDYRRGTYSRQSFDDFKSTKNDVYKLRYIFSALANKTRAPFKGTVFMDCVAFGGRQSGYTFLWDVNAVSVNPDDDSKSCWYEINVKVSASNGEQFIRGTPDGQAKDSKRSSIAPATKTRARFATSALSIADPELPRTKNLRSPFFYHPNPPSREVRHFEDVQKFVECLSRLRHSALPRETLHLTDSYANSTVTADYLRLNSSCRVTLQDLIKTKQRISTRAKYTLAITLTRAILTIYTSGLLCKRLDSKTVLFLVESGKIRVENALLQIKDRSTHGTGIASLYLMGLAENYPIPAVDLGVLLLQIFLPCEKALELAELAESLSFSEQKAKALRTLQSSHVDLTYNCANVISSCLLFDGVYPYGEETDIEKFLVSILHPLEDEFYLACGGGKLGTDGIDTQTILIQDWNKHLPASAIFPDMPKMLDRGLTSPFQFFVLETYAAEIGAGCRRVPWLEESIRQEVTGFENVIHDFRKLPRTTVLDPANFSQTARLIDRCVECLNSIPHLYELESGPAGKALSDLTMQLGLETLRLADLIQTQMSVNILIKKERLGLTLVGDHSHRPYLLLFLQQTSMSTQILTQTLLTRVPGTL